MLGFFKEKIEFKRVLDGLIEDLTSIRPTIDDLIHTPDIANNNTNNEAVSFVYIIGWLAIQSSKLNTIEKHRFSAELTGEWSNNITGIDRAIERSKFLQSRIIVYRDALNDGEGVDWSAKVAIAFLKQIEPLSPEHANILAALHVAIPEYVNTLGEFLDDVKSNYKII